MTHTAQLTGRTSGRSRMERPHRSQLILHWMDACSDPEAHRNARSNDPKTHRDTLVAVWLEENRTGPPVEA